MKESMMRKTWVGWSLMLFFAVVCATGKAAVLQVGTNWPGGGSYADIQGAVNAASDSDEIWVEQGTYTLAATIHIDKSVAIYGGFNGSETSRDERAWTTQITTVDGNDSVRCIHVGVSSSVTVRLDGLTVTGGTNDSSGNGSGVWNGNYNGNITSLLTVANCMFMQNHSGKHAGGIYNDVGFLLVTNSTFTQNTGVNRAGAICNYALTPGITMELIDCTFDQNSAANAGAIYAANNAGTTNVFVGCTFTDNQANPSGSGDGGAILCDASGFFTQCTFVGNAAGRSGGVFGARGDTNRIAMFTDCLFVQNSALYGGALCINGSIGALGVVSAVNCTFADNTLKAGGKGGAVYTTKPTNNVDTVFEMVNCIFRGNATNAIDRSGTTQPLPEVSYSDLDQADYAGEITNSINQNPQFVNTAATNYHLRGDSPCIDAGTSNAPPYDLDGTVRPQGSAYDMGAYEYVWPEVEPSSTNITYKALVDLVIMLAPSGATLTQLVSDVTGALTLDTDYTASGNVYTVLSAYLTHQPAGTFTLTFDMDVGLDPVSTVTVDRVAVAVTGTREYDGTTEAMASMLTITNNLDGTNLTLSGIGTLAGSTVGEQAVSAGTLALNGAASNNYTLVGLSGDVTITPVVVDILRVGPSWSGMAYSNIESAVEAATYADEIWVEQGTYVPSAAIEIDQSIGLYGGFNGSETARTQRNWSNRVTTVDGQDSVLCFHVAAGHSASVILDGFTVTHGTNSGSGGAVWNGNYTGSYTGLLTVANCAFVQNHSGNHGGALYNDVGFMTASNCVISQNTGAYRGGAICNYATTPGNTLILVDCVLEQNSARNAGAVYGAGNTGTTNVFTGCSFTGNQANPSGSGDGGAVLCDASVIFTRCVFDQNAAGRNGGVLGARGDTGIIASFTDCLFARNSALYGAGICINGSSGPLGEVTAVNCTFAGNTLKSGGKGGAIYTSKPTNDVNSVFEVVNCIVWGNDTNAIDRSGTTQPLPSVRYSDLDQSGYESELVQSISLDPRFAGTNSLALQADSPCINVGLNDAWMTSAQDLAGNSRLIGATVDMGTFEYPLVPEAVAVTRAGRTITVDWTLPAGGQSVSIYRSTEAGSTGELVAVVGAGVNTWIDSTVTNSRTFYYSLSAYYGADSSEASAQANVLLPAAYLDFDGDTLADIGVYAPENGLWCILQSSLNTGRFQTWGWNGAVPVPGDYDGDGCFDAAVYAPEYGTWYIWQSATQTARIQSWGFIDAVPVPGDYDGDGLWDLAVYVPASGTWLIWQSATQTMRSQAWGFNKAEPVPGDYDDDGLTDLAVYVPESGTWLIWQSATQTARSQAWGWNEAEPIPGDYDGDGLIDLAVFDPESGLWLAWLSASQSMSSEHWGWNETWPVPADYDGDGKYDRTVYAPAPGMWYLWQSAAQTPRFQAWGFEGADPLN